MIQKWMKPFCALSFLLQLTLTATSETDLSPVLVQCSNATLSSDEDDASLCWKEEASVVCNSLEHGLMEAEKLGTSMLVENTSQCSRQYGLDGEKDSISLLAPLNAFTGTSSLIHAKIPFMEVAQQQLHQVKPRHTYSVFPRRPCSPGYIPKKNATIELSRVKHSVCKCLDSVKVKGIVRCVKIADVELAFIMDGYCMTYDDISGDIVIGYCILSCQVKGSLLDGHTDFHYLPDNASHLENSMCSKLERTGFLCSECTSGHKPQAYSYHLECIPCNLSRKELALNWIKYIALAVLPQSILFLLMAIFRVGVTAPPFSSMVQVFQAISFPLYVRTVLRLISCWRAQFRHFRHATFMMTMTGVLYGFFNLDFFRILNSSFCLNLDFIQLKMLDYASAFWPLLLIILSYVLIELHSRGFKPIVLIWKPVYHCLYIGRCRCKWHIKSSFMETFASFLLLSWIKLLSISCDLLATTCVFTVISEGNISRDCTHLYNSPNIRLFDKRHFLSGIVAILVLIIFIVIPLLFLLAYPLKSFHKILNRCGLHFRALHVFMDSFQGSYKNGTNGTTDYRWFSSSYLIIRILLVQLGPVLKYRLFFPTASIVLMAFAAAVYILQPFKKTFHNTFDATMLLSLAAFFCSHSSVAVAQLSSIEDYILPSLAFTFILSLLPLVIGMGYAVWLFIKGKLYNARRLRSRFRQWWRQRRAAIDDSLPDRVNHPQDYDEMDLRLLPYEELL